MAAPFVSAAAALILDTDPELTPDVIRAGLRQSGPTIVTPQWTGPALDMGAALRLFRPEPDPILFDGLYSD